MKLNDAIPEIKVVSETYEVTADGGQLASKLAEVLPLTQLYSLFQEG